MEIVESGMNIVHLSPLTELDQYGEFATFDEIEIGKKSRQQEWTITDDTIDVFCAMGDEFHEWYSIDSPFGGRIAPIQTTSMIIRALMPYRVGGLFTGWDGKQHEVLRPNVPYIWQAWAADKWIRNDREWVAMEGTCHHPDGRLMMWTRRIHVLDYVTISERQGERIVISNPDGAHEVIDYAPIDIRPRVQEEWERDLTRFPVANSHYGRADMEVGQDLVPVSRQYSWRKARDHAECVYHYMFGWPSWMAAHSFHVHPEAAADKGLPKPNISGLDPTGTLLSIFMTSLAGTGWLQGGEFSYQIVKQIELQDFVTAKGRLLEKREEGDYVRLVCEVWVENQRGTRVVRGQASALVPR